MKSEPPHASSWAAPPEFYLDENVAGRAAGRFVARLGYKVHTPASIFGRAALDGGVEDRDWLPVVGSRGLVVISRDQQILQWEDELRAYLEARVHMFLLPGESTRAQIIDLLRINLLELCTLAVARRSNVYWLTKRGIEPYEQRVQRRRRQRSVPRIRGR
jgi:hypothetical protein